MRGIKFRGWAKVYEKWVYGYYVKFSNMHYIRSVDVYGYEDLYQVDPKSVGQYTECKSVEGEDIYEGDIIVWLDSDGIERRNIIEFVNGGFVVCNNRYNLGSYCTYENQPKIIGNTYENTELIKELEK